MRRSGDRVRTRVVYLLHFDPPYKQAKHYLGSTNDLDARAETHLRGNGSPLVQAALAAGCNVSLARTWDCPDGDGRVIERRLKNRKSAPKLCPFCSTNPDPAEYHGDQRRAHA